MLRFLKIISICWLALSGFIEIVHPPTRSLAFSPTIQTGNGGIQNIEWHPNSELLLVNTPVGAWLYMDTLQEIGRLPGILHATFSPDGTLIAGANEQNQITLWDTNTLQLFASFDGHHKSIETLAWYDNRLASIDRGGHFIIWDMPAGKILFQAHQTITPPVKVAWNPGGTKLAFQDHEGKITVWDMVNGRLEFDLSQLGIYYDFLMEWHSNTVIAGEKFDYYDKGGEGEWDVETQQQINTNAYIQFRSFPHPTGYFASSPDGKLIASSNFIYIFIYQAPDYNTSLFGITSNIDLINMIIWSPDGKKIAYYGDNNILQTSMIDSHILGTITSYSLTGKLISWRWDDQMIATAGHGHNAYLWDTKTGDLLATLQGHEYPISTLAWQPNGSLLATSGWGDLNFLSSSDPTIFIWDTASLSAFPQPILSLTFQEPISDVAWSPDGKRLAILGTNQFVHILDVNQQRITLTIDQSKANHWECCWWNSLKAIWNNSGDLLGISTYREGFLLDGITGEKVWDRSTPEIQQTLYNLTRKASGRLPSEVEWMSPMPASVQNAIFSNDGTRLAGIDQQGNFVTWNMESGKIQLRSKHVKDALWSPDDRLLLIVREDGSAQIMDSHTGKIFESLPGRDHTAFAWSHDSRQLAYVDQGVLKIVEGMIQK